MTDTMTHDPDSRREPDTQASGAAKCVDACGLRPERHEVTEHRSGAAFVRCKVCGRYIGRVRK